MSDALTAQVKVLRARIAELVLERDGLLERVRLQRELLLEMIHAVVHAGDDTPPPPV